MLSHVAEDVSSAKGNNATFDEYYMDYVCRVQDEDVENEILPFIRSKTTEYVKLKARARRVKKRIMRDMGIGIQ